jgi:hypothetical protein
MNTISRISIPAMGPRKLAEDRVLQKPLAAESTKDPQELAPVATFGAACARVVRVCQTLTPWLAIARFDLRSGVRWGLNLLGTVAFGSAAIGRPAWDRYRTGKQQCDRAGGARLLEPAVKCIDWDHPHERILRRHLKVFGKLLDRTDVGLNRRLGVVASLELSSSITLLRWVTGTSLWPTRYPTGRSWTTRSVRRASDFVLTPFWRATSGAADV